MQLDPLLFSFGLIVVPPAIAFPLADSFDTVDFFDNEPTEYASLDLSDADLINSAADHGPNTDWSFPLLGGLTDTPPVADFSLAALAEGNFETSCNPDPEIHYGKRGEICQPEEAPLSNPALQLRLPDLPDLERILRPPVASQDGHDRLLPIPVTLGVSVDVDDRCPPPLRHLCCQGPTEFFDLALFVWKVVVDCRGVHAFSLSHSFMSTNARLASLVKLPGAELTLFLP